jgi:hypothetical protein
MSKNAQTVHMSAVSIEITDEVSATVRDPPLAGDGQGVVVGVLIRGEDGRLVAGSDARFESVTQGGVYPFEASFSVPLPPGVRIETYWTGPVTLAQSAPESS